MLLLPLVVYALPIASAGAATVVTGAQDSTAPLEIRPDTDPATNWVGSGGYVAFIKRMPATRTVVRVTLGELAHDASCSGDFQVRLYLREYQNDDFAKPWIREVQSDYTSDPTLTTTYSDVVFTIPPTTLVEGRAYTFRVESRQPWICTNPRLRTWAHNAPTVGPGVDRCQQVIENQSFDWRMWHEAGENDAVPCPDVAGPTVPYNFEPNMPGGWIHVDRSGTTSYVVTPTDLHSPPGTLPLCANMSSEFGVLPERWRDYPSAPAYSQYVCRFQQFQPPGELPNDGYWYHGSGWYIPGRDGAPRDVHLRLETVNYDQLVRRYLPILRFDLQANYWNASADTIADHWENVIRRGPGPDILFEHEGEGQLSWGLETLVRPPADYPGGLVGPPSSFDYIDEQGDHKAAADSFRFGPYDNRAYARVVHDDSGKLWLQYWFFYYYNEQNVLGVGDHEGDWEMVQYRLNETGVPEVATYAQHSDEEAEGCPWSKVQKVPVVDPVIGTRQAPVVYVAARSQASYFIPGVHIRPGRPDDAANGDGEQHTPAHDMITGSFPSWVRWPGHWGQDDSPASPGNQDKRWSTPNQFHADAGFCANPDGSPR